MRYVIMSVSNAFSFFLKVLRDMSVDHRSRDRLFQTTGPLTGKLRLRKLSSCVGQSADECPQIADGDGHHKMTSVCDSYGSARP